MYLFKKETNHKILTNLQIVYIKFLNLNKNRYLEICFIKSYQNVCIYWKKNLQKFIRIIKNLITVINIKKTKGNDEYLILFIIASI